MAGAALPRQLGGTSSVRREGPLRLTPPLPTFSTITQALAAEFPTAAGVRPVFGSLANVYELLRRRCRDVVGEGAANDSRGEDAVAAAKRIRDSERAMLPFEGRLLVFWRGNGVEETRGRLLLKKLDYLQVCGGYRHVLV